MPKSNLKRNFFLRIVLPTLVVFILFIISFFTFIIPTFENIMLDGKKEMISELTNSAWSILNEFHNKHQAEDITLDEAKFRAVEQIKTLRYGEENKDYFWITDESPIMIVHPYRPELDGTDLNNYSDPDGKKLFVEFVKVIKKSKSGFVNYRWQWKDDSTKIVPKLSYVKEFEPWGWIIGTGIYIEDVYAEIENLIGSIIKVSIGILFLVGMLLFYIGKQSFRIEHERQDAEQHLRESENKYRALVEASTDGLIMILDQKIVYANNSLLELLDVSGTEKDYDIEGVILRNGYENLSGISYFNKLLDKNSAEPRIEAKLISLKNREVDVVMYTSEIAFGDKSGFTIIVKDISKKEQLAENDINDRVQIKSMIDNINIGVFRITCKKKNKFIETNQALLKIFGFQKNEEIEDLHLSDLFLIEEEYEEFIKEVLKIGEQKNRVVQIRKQNGSQSVVSFSAIAISNEKGDCEYIDGIVEDISERLKIDEERENLIVELQTSLKFLHQPVENFLSHIVKCDMNTSIQDCAKVITKHKYSAALITTDNDDYIGIVSDHDLRKRVVSKNINLGEPIHSVMSAPLISIFSSAFVYEALIKMNENSTRHLAVKNNDGKIVGIISSEELFKVERQSSAYLLREIDISESIEELQEIKNKVPRLIKTLVDSGAKAKNITHIVTSIFDASLIKLIEFAIQKYGEPPIKFTFVVLGSAGRKEQTLISDQDNAIIFENVEESKFTEGKNYFDNLAKFVCDGLNKCGYDYCVGEAMAMNKKWTQPLNKWEDYFHKWISNSSQQDLIDVSIFFDFRHVYGDNKLTNSLRKKISELTYNQAGFFQHLTKNCLLHKPPVGFLGNLVLESKGDKAEIFDIKTATMPISDFARINALKYQLVDTNTLERLKSLFNKGKINKNSYDELVQAYNFLMQLRFKHQSTQFSRKKKFDNLINPKELTQIEIKTLKNTFSHIIAMQKKLNYDFSGEAL